MKNKSSNFGVLRKVLAYAILISGSMIVFLPILWIVLASFSSGNS